MRVESQWDGKLQSASKLGYKMRWLFHCKVQHNGLRIIKRVTKCHMISKCNGTAISFTSLIIVYMLFIV